jgi:hypothetical protein
VAGLKNCKDFHAGKNLLAVGFEPAYFSENIFAKISLSPYMFNNYCFKFLKRKGGSGNNYFLGLLFFWPSISA